MEEITRYIQGIMHVCECCTASMSAAPHVCAAPHMCECCTTFTSSSPPCWVPALTLLCLHGNYAFGSKCSTSCGDTVIRDRKSTHLPTGERPVHVPVHWRGRDPWRIYVSFYSRLSLCGRVACTQMHHRNAHVDPSMSMRAHG